jgi:metal-dependent HD superfamily phosphatase/phosphodiesterase
LIAIAAADPSPAAVTTCARVGNVAGGPDAEHARSPGGVGANESSLVDLAAQDVDQTVAQHARSR